MKLSDKLKELAKFKYGDEKEILISLANYYGVDDCLNYEELNEMCDQCVSEKNIIYSVSAMKYLIENDSSLTFSLELADGLGYDCKNINSELLATILLQDNLRVAWNNLKDDVVALFAESEV